MHNRMLRTVAACIVLVGVAACVESATLQEISSDLASLVRRCAPSVVEINADRHPLLDSKAPSTGQNDIYADLTRRLKVVTKSVGSGFVVDADGYILTSAGVVSGVKNVQVKFADGTCAEGKVTGIDHLSDVAVVKVEKTGLAALELGNSDSLEPGALVVSINSQAGLMNSASLGIVAGINRSIGGSWADAIQISGTVGPGASGGPVFDSSGKVVGITAAMFSPSPSALPFNFPNIYVQPGSITVPEVFPDDASGLFGDAWRRQIEKLQKQPKQDADKLRRLESDISEKTPDVVLPPSRMKLSGPPQIMVLDEVAKAAATKDAALALSTSYLDAARKTTRTTGSSGFAIPINRVKPILDDLKSGKQIERAWLGVSVSKKDGALVLCPLPGYPADNAGVKEGDILIEADGRTFDSIQDFTSYITAMRAGDTVKLSIRRDDEEQTMRVTLGKRPSKTDAKTGTRPSRIGGLFSKAGSTFAVDLENAGIEEVAEAVSERSGESIIVTEPEKIKKKVSVHLKSTTVENALDVICRSMGCKYTKDEGIYVISPAP